MLIVTGFAGLEIARAGTHISRPDVVQPLMQRLLGAMAERLQAARL
jgi:hypothetical protein